MMSSLEIEKCEHKIIDNSYCEKCGGLIYLNVIFLYNILYFTTNINRTYYVNIIDLFAMLKFPLY